MLRTRFKTLYESPKVKIIYYPDKEEGAEHSLDVMGHQGKWHRYDLKEGFLAKLAGAADNPCEVRRLLDVRYTGIFNHLLDARINAQALSDIVREAYEKQQAIMARAKKKVKK